MKHTKFTLLAVVAWPVLAFSAAASAQDLTTGTYFSFGGGANLPESSDVKYRGATGAAINGHTTFDTGYMFSGALGYRWSSGMRTEFEANYRRANIDQIAGVDAPGNQRVLGLMGNVLFDIGDWGSFRPYLGGGLGVGWNKWSGVRGNASSTFPAGTATFNDRDPAFQWQGIAGISKALSDRVEGFVEYRYIGLERNKFAGTPAGAFASRHDDRSHNALIGIRYSF